MISEIAGVRNREARGGFLFYYSCIWDIRLRRPYLCRRSLEGDIVLRSFHRDPAGEIYIYLLI